MKIDPMTGLKADASLQHHEHLAASNEDRPDGGVRAVRKRTALSLGSRAMCQGRWIGPIGHTFSG
jgi:hypothetical protein